MARDADGRWRIVGSASRGVADDAGVCGVAPGIYTNIAYYLPWIIATILGPQWAHGAVPYSVTSQADLALAR